MINAVIADDSAITRVALKDGLEQGGRIKVVGSAKNGKEAVAIVKDLKPDILILDYQMPVMNGLDALAKIMSECPLPVLVFSALSAEGADVTIKALELGAVDFVLKPSITTRRLDGTIKNLITKIKLITLEGILKKIKKEDVSRSYPDRNNPQNVKLGTRKIDLIAMGSSTGGVKAAMKLIPKLSSDTAPIVWVQHMPPDFTKSFAKRLDSLSGMKIKEAENGDIVRKGSCYLAPGGFQMKLEKKGGQLGINIAGREKRYGHCPSCNVLFNSVCDCGADNIMGIILTGMGNDGTAGLVKMHNKGAFIIGQTKESCVVYSMPRTAYEAGAVDIELDIDGIAETIIKIGNV